MKNILFLFLIFTCVIFFSCNESPETNFEKNGVSLICPEGWAITDQEDFDGEGYYLAIEKDGVNSSGIATISWVNNFDIINFNFEEHLNYFKETLLEEASFLNITFSDYYENTFSNLSSMSSNYTFSLLGLDHEGTLNVFYSGNKIFYINFQEAIEDKLKNKNGFGIINRNFKSE